MPGWTTWRALVRAEFEQSQQEGRDPAAIDALRPALERAGSDEAALRVVWQQLLAIPIRPDFPFIEPSDLAGIRAARPARAARNLPLNLSSDQLFDRLYGAWLGRCSGCALGKPAEGFMAPHNGLSSRQRIRTYLQAAGPGEWPLNNYFPPRSPAQDKTGPIGWSLQSCRDKLAFMEMDDDICYTVIGQKVLLASGGGFTTRDVAATWLSQLAYGMVCTAETQAYRNLVTRYDFRFSRTPDQEIDWNWVATHENPYREWIGAQIRADAWGYAAPGRPELAADFAWRDARLSHVKNGIYGEMFCAAMIAAAFALDDALRIVEAGLAEIPEKSRLHADVVQTIAICRRHGFDPARFEEVFDEIERLLGHYSPVHTNNNAAIVAAALLLGRHDFEKVITLAVMGGWDTDCNGATAGSIAGAMLGAQRLPQKWTAPLNDTLRAQITGYEPIAISQCARHSLAIAQRVQAETGAT